MHVNKFVEISYESFRASLSFYVLLVDHAPSLQKRFGGSGPRYTQWMGRSIAYCPPLSVMSEDLFRIWTLMARLFDKGDFYSIYVQADCGTPLILNREEAHRFVQVLVKGFLSPYTRWQCQDKSSRMSTLMQSGKLSAGGLRNKCP